MITWVVLPITVAIVTVAEEAAEGQAVYFPVVAGE